MPSLQALSEFKDKFAQISKEDKIIVELKTPFDDLPIPDHEPLALPSTAEEQPESPVSDEFPPDSSDTADFSDEPVGFGDMGDFLDSLDSGAPEENTPLGEEEPAFGTENDGISELEDEAFSDEGDDFGMDLDSLPDFSETQPETDAEATADEAPSDEAFSIPDFDQDSGTPDELLNDLAGDLEPQQDDFGEDSYSFEEAVSDDSLVQDELLPDGNDLSATNDINFEDDLPAFDEGLPQDELLPDGNDLSVTNDINFEDDLPAFDDNLPQDELLPDGNDLFADELGEPGESSDETAFGIENDNISGLEADAFSGDDSGLDLDGLPDFSDTPADTSVDIPSDEDFSVTDFPDFNTDTDTGSFDLDSQDMSLPDADDDGFTLPDDSLSADALPEAGGDTFDSFNLDDNDALPTDIGIDLPSDFGNDETNLEPLDMADDDFGLPGLEPVNNNRSSRPGARSPEFSSFPGAGKKDNIEEILLSDNELEQLQETINSYPLNLRIACKQLIVEEAVEPQLMSGLIKLLVRGASARETASHAGKILGKPIVIPRGVEKKTGEAFEEEQASFAYIFQNKFLPVFRLFAAIALVAASLGYLVWNFIYRPTKAESIYKQGYERIAAGEYNWANRRFQEAFEIQPKKTWFYRYAEAFRDERQYIEAENKYRELLYYTASQNKKGIPDKNAVLEYAAFATNYTKDYQTADTILRRNILDYSVWDREALLALGDNNLAWGEFEPARLNEARDSYVKLIEQYGQTDPILERMLKYFIMTDNLKEVLPLQSYFMFSEKRQISAATLSDLGAYLVDKRTQVVRGVPNEYLESIQGIYDVFLRAVRTEPRLPEPYYHLARYYESIGNSSDEALTLERSLMAFEAAKEETPKRVKFRIDAIRRYAEILIKRRQFFPAEEQLLKGIDIYEDGLARRIITRSPEYGRLYADLGDLEYFVKSGDMNACLDYYGRAERSGFAPPEIQYRMGAAHYHLRQWPQALNRFADASGSLPFNRRILHALGNVSYLRGNYHAAQGYYDKLLEMLDADRVRFPVIMPTDNRDQLELAERLMVAQNNMGVVLEALNARTGDTRYRSRAMSLYTESERAWDIMTRNPTSLVRMRPSPEIAAPGVNPAYLNVQNSLHPVPGYDPQFFIRIDRDILEPSDWEELAPPSYRLSEGIVSGLE
ncbi:MAG: tetratricopeptide repeat protein [Treponema sp.]|jgi:tetratricopeptide (TPR) repeat protein|nr:tetratricopeptide repeat protein [Treponema sp.]